jgi:hypothetical protein
MKTAPRRSKALANWIALLLAVLPAACYGEVRNVWIWAPVSDRTNSVPLRLAIGVYDYDFFAAEQAITNAGVFWSWRNATMDTNSTDNSGSAATEPTLFQVPISVTVTATFSNVTSHGVTVTVVCPKETTAAGSGICCSPPDCPSDPTGTNYSWGGTFTYTYTYVDQNGNTNTVGPGLYWKETDPVVDPTSNCIQETETDYTAEPILLTQEDVPVTDSIGAISVEPPSDCADSGHITAWLGATADSFPCPYTNVWKIVVTQPGSGTFVTTTDNLVTDDYCQY